MLKTRILTALALLAVFIPAALYLPYSIWSVLLAAVVGVAAWEWAGLAGFGKQARLVYGIGLFVVLAAVSWFLTTYSFLEMKGWLEAYTQIKLIDTVLFVSLCFAGLCLVFWFVVVPLWLRCRWPLKGMIGLVIGLFVLIPAWIVAAFLPRGMLFIILSMAWVVDIAAYFTGKRFGKRKLAPTISPGKTWEGAVGAFVALFLYLLTVHLAELLYWSIKGYHFHFGFYNELVKILILLCVALVLTTACVLGDLFESLLKRQAGIKDSSNLLPGHGGVLDRIDSVLAILAVAPMVYVTLWRLLGWRLFSFSV